MYEHKHYFILSTNQMKTDVIQSVNMNISLMLKKIKMIRENEFII